MAVRSLVVLLILSLVAVFPAVAPAPALAQGACLPDTEPNDQPEMAMPVAAPLCIEGTLGTADQDLFIWELSEAEAATTTWDVELRGVPGTLTTLRLLTLSPAGVEPVTVDRTLLTLDAPPDSREPVVGRDLLLPAGRILVGISRTDLPGGGEPPVLDYRVSLEAAGTLPANGDIEPNDGYDTASPVAAAFALAGDLQASNDTYAWSVPPLPEGQRWWIDLRGVLGSGMSLWLLDRDGATLATMPTGPDGRARLVDLELAPADYQLLVYGASDRPAPYALSATSLPAVGDAEPNGEPALGLPIDPSGEPLVRGRLYPDGDVDRYHLVIPDDDAGLLRDVKLFSTGRALARRLCLEIPGGATLQCRDGTGDLALRSMLLAPGAYDLVLSGQADADDGYVLRIDATQAPVPDFETEPNDLPAVATAFAPGTVMRGRSVSGDVDTFRLAVSGEQQLWEVTAAGEGLTELSWIKADGRELATERIAEDGRMVLTDLLLTPGVQWFSVTGEGEYRLEVRPLGPPHPDGEREPNDEATLAEPYRLSRSQVVGRLPRASDSDVFRFSLAAPEHLVLHVEPPADSAIDLRLETGRAVVGERRSMGPGIPTRYEVLLPPGDYEAWLTTRAPSQERYAFRIERADPLTVPVDREPNDSREWAAPLPPTLRIDGSGYATGDLDWYALPPVADGSVVSVQVDGAVEGVLLESPVTPIPGVLDPDSGIFTSDPVIGGDALYLGLSASSDYHASVSLPGITAVEPPSALPLDLELTSPTTEVAAYWPLGQRVAADLRVTNAGPLPAEVTLDAVTSHYLWIAQTAETRLVVPAGASQVVPVEITAGPDAWADEPVRVTVRARSGDGAQTTAWLEVTPRREADPVDPARTWPLPDALLGGLDVASPGLGAVIQPTFDPLMEAQLHDGLAHVGTGLWVDEGLLPLTLDVDLAGDQPMPVAGIILDPLAGDALPGDAPRRFELLLSSDGVTYETVLAGEASPLMRAQPFVLEAPVPATHARLRILSTWPGGFTRVALGEWKVVAEPGQVPTPGPLDLAAPERGGHVSWLDPQQVDPAILSSMLSADLTPQPVYPEGGARVSWALRFRDGRAALVERLQWSDPLPSTPGSRLEAVDVSASLDGPAGPWQALGTWQLDRAPDGSVPAFELPEPTWIRALRFDGRAPGKLSIPVELPGALRVIERPTDGSYRSVLGEWGDASPNGPYEWLAPADVRFATATDTDDDDDSPDRATPLAPGREVEGLLPDGDDVDWYAFSVPSDHNSVAIEAAGRPILVAALTLFDADGLQVPLLFEPGGAPGSIRYLAEVEPGASYRLRVQRPPSSIVFTFDTSASIGPYLDYVYQGLRSFTADVRSGQEAVRIVPFEEESLLEAWSDDPYALQNAVDRFVLGGGSSSAETALIEAATQLSAREGARAILVITDAETSSYVRALELWRILAATRPLIVAVQVGGTLDPTTSRSLMQDWAQVAGGVYQYTRSFGDMDRAFDRLATWLRRPAGYGLTLETAFLEKPPPSRKPGTLAVSSPPGSEEVTISPEVGIEIILDTSGSMLGRLGRQKRIDVARSVLRDLLGERIPAGTNVALRTFGDAAAVCETRLAVPMGPLDPAAMTAGIDGLTIARGTKTPIAASLAEVPVDLAGVKGTQIVLLITDGEETCGGDPAEAVVDLRRRGVDARVNLVGFAIKDRKLKTRMRGWARAGNGSYFDARDSAGLGSAVQRAISAPFRVLDGSGNQVAAGTVDGAPVKVAPGTYSVVVLADPAARFDAVEVAPGGEVALTLPLPLPSPTEPEGESSAADG